MSLTTSAALVTPPALRGEQRPPVLSVPPRVSTEVGREAVEFVRMLGLRLYPWQEFLLEESLATRPDGLHAAPDVGLCVSRQNGKGEVIIARQLVGLFLLDEALQVYTSQLFTTTLEMHRRLADVVYANPSLAKRIKSASKGGNNVVVELKNGHRVKFLARSATSGRGFANVSTLYVDEAMAFSDAEQESLLPTTAASANPQAWYVGSAGIGEPSQVFARIRRRALTGTDERLLWGEWSIPDGADPNDVNMWGFGNPSLGHGRPTFRTLEGYRDNLGPEGFAREHLGRGDWPAENLGQYGPISKEAWANAADPQSEAADPVVFAVAVSLDGSRAAIGVAGRREDSLTHVEVVEHQPGTHWVTDRAAELLAKHPGSLLLLDGGSRANQLVPAMIEAGIPVHPGKGDPTAGSLVLFGTPDVTAAFGSFVSAVTEEPLALRHRPHAGLEAAVQAATVRHVGQALAWDGKNLADVSPLVAVTLAAHGHAKWGGLDYNVLDSIW